MINIHDKLWVIKGFGRDVEDSDQLLAYMTYADYSKDGSESKAFEKRQSTGKSWATPHLRYIYDEKRYQTLEEVCPDYKQEDYESLYDNNPQTGFKIVGSVSRWSTDNKVIRVEDPRGFVVEIPTGNLTTLLKHTTVDKCMVQEECVWGREGNNHILLPVNSDIYQKAREQTNINNERISFTKLNIGDVVKFSVDDKREWVFLGKAKAVWNVQIKSSTAGGYGYNRTIERTLISEQEEIDSKWCFVFKSKDDLNYKNEHYAEYKLSGKAIVVGKMEQQVVSSMKTHFDVYIPDRAIPLNKHGDKYRNGHSYWKGGEYIQATTKEFIWKD